MLKEDFITTFLIHRTGRYTSPTIDLVSLVKKASKTFDTIAKKSAMAEITEEGQVFVEQYVLQQSANPKNKNKRLTPYIDKGIEAYVQLMAECKDIILTPEDLSAISEAYQG